MSGVIALARSMLITSVDRWAAIARVDGSLLDRQPSPGEWSAIQALQHVVDTEEDVFHARILAILAGRDFAAFDPDAEGYVDGIDQTAAALVERLGGLRAATLRTIDGLDEGDLARTAVHPELGRVTLGELLNELAAHDTMHIVQAERALMQAFIPGSGPWRPYFADHDVDAVRA